MTRSGALREHTPPFQGPAAAFDSVTCIEPSPATADETILTMGLASQRRGDPHTTPEVTPKHGRPGWDCLRSECSIPIEEAPRTPQL
jgi:hypothetical protein